jgi:hypothetical protein
MVQSKRPQPMAGAVLDQKRMKKMKRMKIPQEPIGPQPTYVYHTYIIFTVFLYHSHGLLKKRQTVKQNAAPTEEVKQ